MNSPNDNCIREVWTEVQLSSKHTTLTSGVVRSYKDTPDTICLQIWGKRANTLMHASAHLNKKQLIELQTELAALLEWLP